MASFVKKCQPELIDSCIALIKLHQCFYWRKPLCGSPNTSVGQLLYKNHGYTSICAQMRQFILGEISRFCGKSANLKQCIMKCSCVVRCTFDLLSFKFSLTQPCCNCSKI